MQIRYSAKQIGKFFGYEGQELDTRLREWEKRGLLVPGEDKNYSAEDVITRLMQIGKDKLFREWGYGGEEKGGVFRAVSADLKVITDGGKKQQAGRAETPVEGSNYQFHGEHGPAYKALVRQYLPDDDLALRIVAEATKSPEGIIDWNRAGKYLPKEFRVRPDLLEDAFRRIVNANLMTETGEGYKLRPLVTAT